MSSLPETKHSLLLRLRDASNDQAWMEFVELYENAVFRFVRSKGLQEADAYEVVQEVLLAVHRSIDGWNSRGAGSFRAWLRRVSSNIATTVVRRKIRQRIVTGGTTIGQALSLAESPDGDRESVEDLEWRQWAFAWAAEKSEREVSAPTWQAFWLTAVENRAPSEVAEQLQLSIGAVYAAKCRVLQRMRDAVAEIDNDCAVLRGQDRSEISNEEL